jgi:hypothetical protein
MVSGPSGSGKSSFIVRFLECIDAMCDTKFESVTWCYAIWQPLYSHLHDTLNITFHKGIPEFNENRTHTRPTLIIFDDLMSQSNQTVTDLFTKGSHHLSTSVIFITQNLFHRGKGMRDISLNCHYIVCFKNPRDAAQFSHLSRQVVPKNSRFLQESYEDACSKPHGYILLDLKQETPDNLRFRTNIFPGEKLTVYVEKV